MSLFLETKQHTYKLQRSSSQGAALTLVAGCDEYTAMFDCAKKVKDILGTDGFKDYGDGIYFSIPAYHIPFADMHAALKKISAHHSIALLDYTSTRNESRFILVWKINSTGAPVAVAAPKKPATNLDEY